MTEHDQKRTLIFMLSCLDFDVVAFLLKNPELLDLARQHTWPAASGVLQLLAQADSAAAMTCMDEIAK